jgi:TonB-linked SusC/RagA family outer membrane protein
MRIYKITLLLLCLTTALCIDISKVHAQNTYSFTDKPKHINAKRSAFDQQTDDKNEKNKLINILKDLNKAKGVYFMFSNQLLGNKIVNLVDDMNENVEVILDKVLKNTGLTYKKINNNTFVIITQKDADKSATGAQNIGYTNMITVEPQTDFTAPYDVIRGKVVDKNGNPVAGVTVAIKGKKTGTSTNSNGVFTIDAEKGDVLIFTSVGYELQQVVVGDDSNIEVALVENSTQLNTVVVTALGIERKSKSLTYATQKVNNSDLTTVKDASFVNSLTGKIAGVTITKSSSGIGGSTRVVLRGNKSTRQNQPLYVVDGIPLVNFSPAQPGDEWGQSGVGFVGLDGGDGIANLNPDDIESVSVLKGASAAALYGSSAANGVILINTKKGRSGTTKVDVSSEITFDNRLYKQPLQFKYGQTTSPSAGDPGSADSWGGIVNAPNHVDQFFQTGVTTFNSISLTGGTDKSQTYFSYSYTDNKGIIPTAAINKHNINIRQTSKFFNDRLVADANVLFIHQNSHNRPVSGLYDNSLPGLYQFPRGLDFNKYKEYEVYSSVRNTNIQNWWDANFDSSFAGTETEQNPYWLLYRNPSDNSLDRVYSNITLRFKINDWLSLQARGNVDKSFNDIDLRSYATTSTVLTGRNGSYSLLKAINTQLYGDLLLTGNKKLTNNLGLSATIGTSINDGKADQSTFGTAAGSKGLNVANVFALANILPNSLSITQTITHRQVQALFATAQLSFNDYLFLDLTGRNDWSSTLAFTPTEKKGFFYYSAGINAVLSDMFKMPEPISFGKIRASYAKVGNDVNAFVTNPPPFYVIFSSTQTTSVNTKGPVPGTYLRPEDNRSFEVGTEWRFLKDRVGFDITYYENNNYQQYLEVPAPNGSGLNTYYLNGGNIRNRGIELSISGTPFSSKNVKWNTTLNYSMNKNKIISLSNDKLQVTAQSYTLTGLGNLLYASYLAVGGSWGDIYGRFFQRDANGAIVVDANGAPQKGNDPDNKIGGSDQKLLGNPNPRYTFGWNNTINIKSFSIGFLIDGKVGGKVMSVTNAVLDKLGDSKVTADARDAGGVTIDAVDDNGQKVTSLDAKTFYQAVGGRDGISEYYMYDATNVRLREASIGYLFNVKGGFLKTLRFSVIGRNLFFITKKAPFDPDISMATNNGLQGTETFGIPSTRSIGFSLKAGF